MPPPGNIDLIEQSVNLRGKPRFQPLAKHHSDYIERDLVNGMVRPQSGYYLLAILPPAALEENQKPHLTLVPM
jgi:hypothetical protein